MKKLLILLSVAFLMLFLVACSEKDDDPTGPTTQNPTSPTLATTPDAVITLDYATIVADTTMTAGDYTAVPAAHLQDLIPKATLDALIPSIGDYESRKLFAYEFTDSATEPYTSRGIGYDISWDLILTGFFLPEQNHRNFFPTLLPTKKANVQGLTKINAYRKFDVINPAKSSSFTFELNGMTTTTVAPTDSTTEAAIALKDFIPTFVTANPANYTYLFHGIDTAKYDPISYTWEEIQRGYWLMTSKKTMFKDANGAIITSGTYKFKKLLSIELVPKP